MGVLNLTPDSFSDGGKFNTSKKGLKHTLEMFKPFLLELNFPPSEKLSGVRFNTPIIFGICKKFKFEKFLFFDFIFFKSNLINLFNDFVRPLILFIEIFFF